MKLLLLFIFLLIYSKRLQPCFLSILSAQVLFKLLHSKTCHCISKNSLINSIHVFVYIYKHQNNSLLIRTNTDNSSFLDIYVNLQVWYSGLLTSRPGPLHFSLQYLQSFSSPPIVSVPVPLNLSEYFPYK